MEKMIIQAQPTHSFSLCSSSAYNSANHRQFGVRVSVGVERGPTPSYANWILFSRFPSLSTMSSTGRSSNWMMRRRKRSHDVVSSPSSSRSSGRAAASGSAPPPPVTPVPPAAEKQREVPELRTLLRRFWKVAAPYWSSDDKAQARMQLGAVFALTLATTGISVGFNFLGRDFYNALANKDQEQFTKQLFYYLGAFAGGIPVSTNCLLHFHLDFCVARLCKRNSFFEVEILDDKILHGSLLKQPNLLQNSIPINHR